MKLKAVIYARYSSDNQREESIDAQIRAINEYAQRQGIIIVKTYTDEAKSATTDQRPQFLEMMRDAEKGSFQAVIVHKLDRFSRDRYDSAHYKQHLKKHGITLISVLENLDGSPESIILESVLEGMAEYYSRNLAREVMKGMKETALQCRHTGGKPPLGYDLAEDKKYILNELEAKIITTIFDKYAKGAGYREILSRLNEAGYKTKSGQVFGKNSIHDILKNEKYCGVYVFNRTEKKINGKRNHHKSKNNHEIIRIEDGIPRIVSNEIWEEVQKRMSNNKHNKGANKTQEKYLLSGLIFCGKCDGALVGNKRHSGRNKTKYLSYECSSRKRKKTCDMKSSSAKNIENIVLEELESKIFSSQSIDKLAQKVYDFALKRLPELQEDLKLYENELKDVLAKIDNIVNAVADGLFHDSFKGKMDFLENRKAQLNILISEAKQKSLLSNPTLDMIKSYIEKDAGLKNKSPDEQIRIIRAYVQKVIVHENELEIFLIVDFDGGGEPYHNKVQLKYAIFDFDILKRISA